MYISRKRTLYMYITPSTGMMDLHEIIENVGVVSCRVRGKTHTPVTA